MKKRTNMVGLAALSDEALLAEVERRARRAGRKRAEVTSASEAFYAVRNRIASAPEERVVAVLLNTRSRVIDFVDVARGTLADVALHPREVFSEAIGKRAAAIVLAHNHPSGDTTPSEEDIETTCRLLFVSHLLGIPLLDHLVVSGDSYTSIRLTTQVWEMPDLQIKTAGQMAPFELGKTPATRQARSRS